MIKVIGALSKDTAGLLRILYSNNSVTISLSTNKKVERSATITRVNLILLLKMKKAMLISILMIRKHSNASKSNLRNFIRQKNQRLPKSVNQMTQKARKS